MKKLLCLFLFSILGLACTPEEKVINPVNTTLKILVATDESLPKLKLIELPSLTVLNEDIIKNSLGMDINSPVETIKEFGGNYYIMIPGDHKILVVKKADMTLVKTIDFSEKNMEPDGIVFANGTDAYITHRNSVYLSLLDITNFVVSNDITVGNPPHSIAVSGNQIYVTNRPDNTISVVDSRLWKEVAKINTEPNPSFIQITRDNKSAVCICAGMGKFDTTETKTAALAHYISIEKREITSSTDLGFAQILPADQFPQGLALTPSDWGFIPTKDNLFRIDLRTRDRINLVVKRNFYFINYDNKNSRIILLREIDGHSDILFANEKTGDIGDYYSMPYKVKYVFPY